MTRILMRPFYLSTMFLWFSSTKETFQCKAEIHANKQKFTWNNNNSKIPFLLCVIISPFCLVAQPPHANYTIYSPLWTCMYIVLILQNYIEEKTPKPHAKGMSDSRSRGETSDIRNWQWHSLHINIRSGDEAKIWNQIVSKGKKIKGKKEETIHFLLAYFFAFSLNDDDMNV